MQTPSQLGTESLERFITQLFQVSETIDKNADGKISGAEWGAAAFELFLSFVSNKNLTAEVRDLDIDEIAHLVDVVAENFPDYKGLRNEVEDVVRAALHTIATVVISSRSLFVALHALNNKPADLPVVEPAVPFVDNSNNPTAPSKTKWVAPKVETPAEVPVGAPTEVPEVDTPNETEQ